MWTMNIPTEIIFGRKCIQEKGDRIRCFGKKALIVTGKRSAKLSGALNDILMILADQSKEYVIFDDVTENPEIDIINRGITQCLFHNCDFVIAIGGGSPLDAAKAIALGAASQISGLELFIPGKHLKALPLIAVPTTSGTGSEVTQYSVLTDEVNKKKAGFGSSLIYPKVSFLDPTYTLSLSVQSTRDTAIDALSHLLEGLYSKLRNPLIYPFIYEGVKLIWQNLENCLNNPLEYSLRSHLMQASLYGGLVIAQSGTTMQHSIGYPLTSNFGISHGLANGLVMKSIMELYYPSIKDEVDNLLSYLGIGMSEFFNWLESLELKTEVKLTDDFIEEKIEEVLNSRNMVNNPIDITSTQIRQIYYQLK